MRIYFVRHGESKSNALNLHQTPDVPLSSRGRKQATAAARRFLDIKIDVIISSDYIRAKETAYEISKIAHKEIVFTPLFRERKRPSELSGKHFADPEAKRIGNLLRKNSPDKNWHYSDEENFFDLAGRGKKALQTIEKRQENHIAVVSHGAFIKLITGLIIFGERLTHDLYDAMYSKMKINNTGITVCQYKKDNTGLGRWSLLTWNDRIHVK